MLARLKSSVNVFRCQPFTNRHDFTIEHAKSKILAEIFDSHKALIVGIVEVAWTIEADTNQQQYVITVEYPVRILEAHLIRIGMTVVQYALTTRHV